MTLPNKLQSIFTSEQKYTVLQLIAALIDATKEGTVSNIEVIRIDAARIKLRFINNDGGYIDTDPIVIGSADMDTVYALLQAGSNVTITKNTSDNKVVIGLSSNISVGNVMASGSVTAGSVSTSGSVTAGSVSSRGSVTAGSVSTSGNVSAGSLSAGNTSIDGNLEVSGNIKQAGIGYTTLGFNPVPITGSTRTPIYNRAVTHPHMLIIVINEKIEITAENYGRNMQFNCDLSDNIAALVTDLAGHKASEAVDFTLIAATQGTLLTTIHSIDGNAITLPMQLDNIARENRINVAYQLPAGLAVGTVRYFTGRIVLTL